MDVGRASGTLPSQSSVALSDDGRWLLVINAGSDELSLFEVEADGLRLADHVGSGGSKPTSVAVNGALVYVLNNGTPSISGFNLVDDRLTALAGDTHSEVCWALVTNDGRFAFVTNFGSGTVSSYEIAADGSLTLRDPVAGATRKGEKGVRDEALSSDGQYLYAIDADARKVFGWSVGQSAQLTPVGEFEGVPDTVAGLAAS